MKRFIFRFLTFILILIGIVCSSELFMKKVLRMPKVSLHRSTSMTDIYGPKIKKADVIFIGDSRIEWDIKPKVFDSVFKTSKISSLNLGMPGSNGLDILHYLKARKIYPPIIVLGYSCNIIFQPGFNFEVPKSGFSIWTTSLKSKLTDYLSRNFICAETQFESVKSWKEHKKPYFLKHQYDDQGGVDVWERGDYNDRTKFNVTAFEKFQKNFKQKALDSISIEIEKEVAFFKSKGTQFITIKLPCSNTLIALESDTAYSLSKFVQPIMDLNFNTKKAFPASGDYRSFFVKYTPSLSNSPDSTIFLDASHLKHDVSRQFTLDFANIISTLPIPVFHNK